MSDVRFDRGETHSHWKLSVEFPRSRENGSSVSNVATLADSCEIAGEPLPDLVLLKPEKIPSDAMALQLAAHERFEVGTGYVHARLSQTDAQGRETLRDMFAQGRN